MHKLPRTLRTPKFLTNNAAICPTVFKAETCRNINQQTKNLVQKVGVKFYICNIVGPKMYNFKWTYLFVEVITSRLVILLAYNKTSMLFFIVRMSSQTKTT